MFRLPPFLHNLGTDPRVFLRPVASHGTHVVTLAAAREAAAGEAGESPWRNASMVGLGDDHYMSAYKKLLTQT